MPLRHLGYVATALSISARTNRTCRLHNATPERLRQLIRLNLCGLRQILQFNVENGIFLFRISSQIIPFASHPVNRVPWWEEYASLFAELGEFIARHRLRVSMHPGQFTVLDSPDEQVVAASLRELQWHARFLECLGTDASHKVVIHIGGAYGAIGKAVDRFLWVVNRLPEATRRRLVIENDERAFTVEEVLNTARRGGLPVVFDWLHHKTNPGGNEETSRLISQCFATWEPADGLPKVHLSSQARGGSTGQHAYWIEPEDFLNLLRLMPRRRFDCMLEAKGKDLALFRLRSQMRVGVRDGGNRRA